MQPLQELAYTCTEKHTYTIIKKQFFNFYNLDNVENKGNDLFPPWNREVKQTHEASPDRMMIAQADTDKG